jgi:hypothetical protein
MRLIRAYRPILLTAGLLSCLQSVAGAQSYWHDDAGRAQYRLELLKPFVKNVDESFLTGSAFLSGSFLVGTGLRLEAELPFTRAAFSLPVLGDTLDISGSRIGNPYIGLVSHQGERPFAFRLGVRLPLSGGADDLEDLTALAVGGATDLDRIEAFAPELITLRGGVEWLRVQPGGLLLGAALGPSLLVDDGFDDAELLGDYGFRLGYRGEAFQTYAALTGRINLTSDDAEGLPERTQHQLTGAIAMRRGRLRPEAMVRFPLDEGIRDLVGVIVGAGVRLVY